MSRKCLLALFFVLLLVHTGSSLAFWDKGQFQSIEVVRFEIQEGVEFPADYLISLTDELVAQLQKTGKFKEVLREGESSSVDQEQRLQLRGTVIKFQAGSRAKRYIIGFGAGKTKIVADVQWIDGSSGKVLFQDKVDGKVILGGAVKGESIGATRGLAKEVAKVTRSKFF